MYDSTANSNDDSKLLKICFWISVVIFLTFTIFAVILLAKVRLKLDRLAIWCIVIYEVSDLTKLINWAIKDNFQERHSQIYFDISNGIISFFAWLIIYFFIFEMQYVKIVLESQTQEELKKHLQRSRKYKQMLVIYFIVIFVILMIAYILRKLNDDGYPTSVIVLTLINTCAKGILDIIMLTLYVSLINYMIQKKREKTAIIGVQLSCYDIFVICEIFALIVLNIFRGAAPFIVDVIFLAGEPRVSERMYTVLFYFCDPIIDFLNQLSSLQLFYRLSRDKRKKSNKNKQGSSYDNLKQESRRNYNTKSLIELLKNSVIGDTDKSLKRKSQKTITDRFSLNSQKPIVEEQQYVLVSSRSSEYKKSYQYQSQKSSSEHTQFRSFLYEQIAIYKKNHNQF